MKSKNQTFILLAVLYAEAWNEWRGPSPQLSAWVTQLEETSERWRAVGDTVSDLTDLGIKPQTSRTDSIVSTTELTGRLVLAASDIYNCFSIITAFKISEWVQRNQHICVHPKIGLFLFKQIKR